jgi:hypothetical protein
VPNTQLAFHDGIEQRRIGHRANSRLCQGLGGHGAGLGDSDMGSDKNRSKFVGFFKLMDAMKKPGCPACRRIGESTQQSMDCFLYENINDPELRGEIRRDGGLCNRHSWQLARFGDALGGAILFGDVLQSVIPKLSTRFLPSRQRAKLTRIGTQACRFCRLEQETHASVLAEIAMRADDAELSAAWNGPCMMCIPHLCEVCSGIADPAARDSLLRIHQKKYRVLCEQMSESVARQSYDRCHEPSGPEKDSWLRAIQALTGQPEVR